MSGYLQIFSREVILKFKKLGEDLREVAVGRVLKVLGSYDAPGFEACVKAEIENIMKGK